MAKEIWDRDDWNALPVGTATRVETFKEDEDGNQKDIIVFLIRVEADVRVDAGQVMLAGGNSWRYAWDWAEGCTAGSLDELLKEVS